VRTLKIKKVDDKPMVIHTKEKAKIHAHEPKGAKIKGSNIYTVERGPKVHDAKANEMDKKASAKLMLQKSAGGKRTYRKSTIHQSEAKDKGLSRFKRNIRESGTSIKTKNTNLHIAGRTGALAAGAVTEQVEGGQEVSQAAYLAYESSRPVTGTASKGAALFRKKAAAEAKKRIKKVEAGKKLAKKTAKKAAKDTAKTVAKETAKETAKTTAKVATKTATKAAATAAGTAVAPGVGTAIGMAAGYAAGVSIEVKDEKMTNRSRKIKFFLDKMRAQENQTDSVAKLVKDLIVRKAITWVKAAAPIIGLVLLLLVLVVAMIAVPVIAVIAILYNSPFALFLPPLESGDTVQTVTSAYVQEFNRDVNTKVNEHTGYDLGELVYVDYEGMEENPSNYYDIMAVYMVKHGIGDTATVMNDISKGWLQAVVIESERRIGYVRRNDLQGSGRTALSADRDAGRDGGSHEAGQIRKDGDELSKGERAGKIQDADEIREDVREDVSGRGGSEPAVRPVRDAVSGEAQATESDIDNGDVEDKRAGEDAGRGSGTESDSDAIPLESDDTELNRELDEINSLGVSKEAEYTQASFFFDQNGQASIGTIHTEDENNNQFMRQFEQDRKAALAGKYNYLNPKKSATVPGEYIKQVLMRGGVLNQKRICEDQL